MHREVLSLKCMRKTGWRFVGFGFGSFVKTSFAEDEVRNPRPGLNSRIIESIGEGNSVIATCAEVRDANTRGDLEQGILDISWKNGPLTAAQVDLVRVLLGRAYQELFAGYHFSRILTELVDELDIWHVRGQKSFRVISQFEDFRRAHPATAWNPDRQLMEATLDTMRVDPDSVGGTVSASCCSSVCIHAERAGVAGTGAGRGGRCFDSEVAVCDLARDQAPLVEHLRTCIFAETGLVSFRWRPNQRYPKAPTHPDLCQKSSGGVAALRPEAPERAELGCLTPTLRHRSTPAFQKSEVLPSLRVAR
jgi:hypothetical protein